MPQLSGATLVAAHHFALPKGLASFVLVTLVLAAQWLYGAISGHIVNVPAQIAITTPFLLTFLTYVGAYLRGLLKSTDPTIVLPEVVAVLPHSPPPPPVPPSFRH